ncbi:MAG: GTPase domain-containing protein [bacterium]
MSSGIANPLRISIVGPSGSGKLTALRTLIGNVPVNQRGRLTPVESESEVLLSIQLGSGHLPPEGKGARFEICTVHGEVSSQTTWRKLLQDAEGVIFLADAAEGRLTTNSNNLRRVRETLESLERDPDEIPWVFAWNRRDLSDESLVGALNGALNVREAPAFETVATTGYGLLKVLKSIRDQILSRREQKAEVTPGKMPESAESSHEARIPDSLEPVVGNRSSGVPSVTLETVEPETIAAIPPGEAKTGIEALPSIDPDEMVENHGSMALPGYATVHPANERADETKSPAGAEVESTTQMLPGDGTKEQDAPGIKTPEGGEAKSDETVERADSGTPDHGLKKTENVSPKKSFGFITRSTMGVDETDTRAAVFDKDASPEIERVKTAEDRLSKQNDKESVSREVPSESGEVRPEMPEDRPKVPPEKNEDNVDESRPAGSVRGPVFRFPEVKPSSDEGEHHRQQDESEEQDRGGLWRRLARNLRNKEN